MSGVVRSDLSVFFLYFTPKVPIDAVGILLRFKIWKYKSATEVLPLVPVTAIKFFGFNL